ncbi:MAG: HAD family hydrolase [Nitrospirae bacterium]|nr:MAG: HAD family hydrolase [Nitrospirota bacterium]
MMNCFLFDVDGTLVDTRELISESLVETIGDQTGQKLEKDSFLEDVHISPLALLKRYGIDSLDAYWSNYNRYIGLARLFDEGTPEVLDELRKREIRLGVVSSLRKAQVELLLNRVGLISHFQIVLGYHRHHKKPHPGQIQSALSSLGVPRTKAAYIGDQDVDLLAAKRAEVTAILVGWSRAKSFSCQPDHIIKSFAELLDLV